MRDTIAAVANVVGCAALSLYFGIATIGAIVKVRDVRRAQREAAAIQDARWSRFMRDCYAPPVSRNAPLNFFAGCDSTAADLLIADAGGRAPQGEE